MYLFSQQDFDLEFTYYVEQNFKINTLIKYKSNPDWGH